MNESVEYTRARGVINPEEPGGLGDGQDEVRHFPKLGTDPLEVGVGVQDRDINARGQEGDRHGGLGDTDAPPDSVVPRPRAGYAKPAHRGAKTA